MATFPVLKIEIAQRNDAMETDGFNETARMLRQLADRIERLQEWPKTEWGIFDTNGNFVGVADTKQRRIRY